MDKKYLYNDIPPWGISVSVIVQSAVVAIMNIAVLLLVFREVDVSAN